MLAFAGKQVNPFEPHSVVWAGIVSEKMSFADYWNDRRFAGKKPDRSKYPDRTRPALPTFAYSTPAYQPVATRDRLSYAKVASRSTKSLGFVLSKTLTLR